MSEMNMVNNEGARILSKEELEEIVAVMQDGKRICWDIDEQLHRYMRNMARLNRNYVVEGLLDAQRKLAACAAELNLRYEDYQQSAKEELDRMKEDKKE